MLWFTITAQVQPRTSHLLPNDTGIIRKQLQQADSMIKLNMESALPTTNEALERSRQLKFNSGIVDASLLQALIYQSQSKYLLSIRILQAALPHCALTSTGNIKKVRILSMLGADYWYNDQADSAAFYYYKALDEAAATNISTPSILTDLYSNLIVMWVNLNDAYSHSASSYDKYIESAISYFNKAAQQKDQDEATGAKVFLNMGHIKKIQSQYDSSTYYYHRWLQVALNNKKDRYKNSGWILATLINISENFLKEKKADSAIVYAREAINRSAIGNGSIYYIVAYYHLGKAYCIQQKYKEAIAVTLPALRHAEEKKIFHLSYMAHDILAEAFAATGKYDKAWKEQKAYTTITDSLRKSSSIQTINQIELRYRMAEKELAITRKDNSLKNQRMLIITISGGAIMLLLMSWLLYRHQTNKQRIRLLQVEQQMEISHLNAMIQGEEKERRRLATELHDGIGGLLGSIRLQLSSAIKTHKTEDRSEDFSEILTLLESTYSDLRKTAHNLMPETLQQEGLEKAARLFCRSLAVTGGTEIIFETVGKIPLLPSHTELSLYRIMQELVHNIIKHSHAKKALVQLAGMENRVALTVEDDGAGFVPDQEITGAEEQGMGLFTIRNRIKLMGGQMDVSSSPGKGTSIYIEIIIGKAEHNTITP